MAENSSQLMKPVRVIKPKDDLRLLPYFVAGLFCFATAVAIGYGSWFFFNIYRQSSQIDVVNQSNSSQNEIERSAIDFNSPSPTPTVTATPISTPTPEITAAPSTFENVVLVKGSEIVIGGGETKRPLQRLILDDFYIAETEVTNSQYAEFIKETGYKSPIGWNKTNFPKGTENFPATNISWVDAKEFCVWMTKKVGSTVRLPTEAEWELAGRGQQGFKYSWGNEWQKDVVQSKEKGGDVTAVKKSSIDRSPFGAYDMVGNVWEWTQDKVETNEATSSAEADKALKSGKILRIVKGGSINEPKSEISVQSRKEVPENVKVRLLGFRYVIEKK